MLSYVEKLFKPYIETDKIHDSPSVSDDNVIALYGGNIESNDSYASSEPTERKRKRRSINIGSYATLKLSGDKVKILDKTYNEEKNEWYYAIEGFSELLPSCDLIAPRAKKNKDIETENA